MDNIGVWDQFGLDYDHPEFLGNPQCYLIASTPRSGSHYLAHLLAATGQAGGPLEYFHSGHMERWSSLLASQNSSDLFKKLFSRRTSSNGWFGVKAHWTQFSPIYQNKDLMGLFRFEKYIYIERKDKLAQAISLAIARQTNAWISHHHSTNSPAYNFDQIQDAIRYLSKEEYLWKNFFEKNDINYLKIFYEDLLLNPMNKVSDILKLLKIKSNLYDLKHPFMPKIQGDSINSEWIKRYREEFDKKLDLDVS